MPDLLKFLKLINSNLVCCIYVPYESFIVYLDGVVVLFCTTNIYN